MNRTRVAVVTPHFQRKPGLLGAALQSAFSQTAAEQLVVIVVDDGSPISAVRELDAFPELPRERIIIREQENGGAGAARNNALDHIPEGIEFVAFLDSDDCWRPQHIENALHALELGYDAYFADFYAVGYPAQSNFERIGTLQHSAHRLVDPARGTYELCITPIEHIVADGGGLIQTSTVVYRYSKFSQLRFREEFYNGQDFFFWMDLGELGARFSYSTSVECDNGEGINIYQGSGWGTERSLRRLRNEIFVWTSVGRIYSLSDTLKAANRRTIRNLQQGVVRDVLYRLRRGKPVSMALVKDIVRYDPTILALVPAVPFRVLSEKLFGSR